ncbi:hypothetical protein [Heyndrickxia acidiproducens]|uniref:hypothetical protein n=1 Tax=Heyndrickxia acidiproducens TaxID=1121084 RepID=UPI00037F39B1|nr:hypothetical protein [Heyndrickxia acidiproducens]
MDLLTLGVSVIAFLIVLVILFVFPFCFTKKGIILLVSTSFLLALFSLVANSVLPLWESSLITFLLVLCCSYLLEKRIPFLFAETDHTPNVLPGMNGQETLLAQPPAKPAMTEPEVFENLNAGAGKTVSQAGGSEGQTPVAAFKEKAEPVPDWEEIKEPASAANTEKRKAEGKETDSDDFSFSQADKDEISFLEDRLSFVDDDMHAGQAEKEADQETIPIEDWIMALENPDTSLPDTHSVKEPAGKNCAKDKERQG